jgi:hypothetical protein
VPQIELNYYVGADGPTLRLDFQRAEDAFALAKMLRRLSQAKDECLSLVETLKAECFGLASWTCHLDRTRRLRLVQTSGALHVSWHGRRQDWRHRAMMALPLARLTSPGHQYLDDSVSDDAIIVVACMESDSFRRRDV